MTYPIKNDVLVALLSLGKTRDSILSRLTTAGIQGCGHHTQDCPISQYLNKHFPGTTASVGPDSISIGGTWIKTPEPIADFVRWVNNGKIPGGLLAHAEK